MTVQNVDNGYLISSLPVCFNYYFLLGSEWMNMMLHS